MSYSALVKSIFQKYDLIESVHVGSSLLSHLSPIYRQFGLWARYIGESISRPRQDHLNFYKWLFFELTAPNFDLPSKNSIRIPGLGNIAHSKLIGAG